MARSVIPIQTKYTRFPPRRSRWRESAKSDVASVGAIVRVPEPAICDSPLAVPIGPPGGTLSTTMIWIEPARISDEKITSNWRKGHTYRMQDMRWPGSKTARPCTA